MGLCKSLNGQIQQMLLCSQTDFTCGGYKVPKLRKEQYCLLKTTISALVVKTFIPFITLIYKLSLNWTLCDDVSSFVQEASLTPTPGEGVGHTFMSHDKVAELMRIFKKAAFAAI